MIELLIVIAILGILAVAVLSAINPIEQINRGRDTGSRSDAEQLLTAIDRYYAMQGYFPWQMNPNDPIDIDDGTTGMVYINDGLTGISDCPILYLLSDVTQGGAACADSVGSQELKVTYVDKVSALSYNELYIYHDDIDYSSTYVCFAPQSNAFRVEALARFDTDNSGVIEASEVPSDYPANAYAQPADGLCGSDGNCVCLP